MLREQRLAHVARHRALPRHVDPGEAPK
jgi:hypothetical protein